MRTLFAALVLFAALPAQSVGYGNIRFSSDVTAMPAEWNGKPAFLLLIPRDETRDQHQRAFAIAMDDEGRKSYGARVILWGLLDARPCMTAEVGWRGMVWQRLTVTGRGYLAWPGVPYWTVDDREDNSLIRYVYHGNPYVQRNLFVEWRIGCYCANTLCDAPCYLYDGHPQPQWMFMLVTIEALN